MNGEGEQIMSANGAKFMKVSLFLVVLVGLSLLIPHESGLRGPFVFGGFFVAILSLFKSSKS